MLTSTVLLDSNGVSLSRWYCCSFGVLELLILSYSELRPGERGAIVISLALSLFGAAEIITSGWRKTGLHVLGSVLHFSSLWKYAWISLYHLLIMNKHPQTMI